MIPRPKPVETTPNPIQQFFREILVFVVGKPFDLYKF